jgi:competence CoiA-like predicted nuclease
MWRKKTLAILLLAMPFLAMAQSRTYDRLVLNDPPEGWTTQTLTDRVIFSNDHIKGADALAVSIIKGSPITDKPDIAFKKYWQQYFQLADTATTPRPRKLYNIDGVPMLSASMEMTMQGEKHFYVVTLYFDEQYAQSIVIKSTSQKVYKTVQNDWLQKLQEVTLAKRND